MKGKARLVPMMATIELPEGEVPAEIQILPFGEIRPLDGRGPWWVTERSYTEILTRNAARKNPLVIDYEHQSLYGVEAPAAGWMKQLESRGAAGLWAVNVEWTPRARLYLQNREYRFLSPVFYLDPDTREIIEVIGAGLTNNPAIDGMVPLVARRELDEEGDRMKEKLQQLLGLPEGTPEDKLLESASARLGDDRAAVACAALGLDPTATAAEIQEAARRLKEQAPDPDQFVPRAEYERVSARVDALEKAERTRTRDALVEEALRSGKLAPASRQWAEQYAERDPEGFRQFLATAPAVIPIGGEVAGGGATRARRTGMDETQAAVNRMLGISDEVFAKYAGQGGDA